MQRFSRDKDRDDEGGAERRGQARNDERNAYGGGYARREFGGGSRSTDDVRAGRTASPTEWSASRWSDNDRSNRWGGSAGSTNEDDDRARFEQAHSRSIQQSDYTGGAARSGSQRDDDWRDQDWRDARSAHDSRERGQPGGSGSMLSGQRRGPSPQYGETEYGVYGPHDALGSGDRSGLGAGSYRTGSQSGSRDQAEDERNYDRWNRQGYGRSGFQHGDEPRGHPFDPDYQQWRAEQIRNLDSDYARYRQERYRRFADEFDLWRKSQATRGQSATGSADGASTGRSPMSQSGPGHSAMNTASDQGSGATGSSGNQSGMGSSGGQTSAGSTSPQDSASKETARDSLGNAKR